MSEAVEKKYWFKAKRYGWGWGLPQMWQGWISFGLFIAVWLIAMATLMVPNGDNEIPASSAAWFFVIVAADILGLLYVSFKYGEPPKWRWGKKK